MRLASLAFMASIVSAASLPSIEIKGNAFYNSETNERFFIRGVDYQPGGSSNLTDPLGDSSICGRDIPYFEELNLNTIRIYSIDNTQDHSECMQKLADAGIYVILDVNTPEASISRWDTSCSYNSDYLNEVFSTIDEFATYNNTLGFFAANELINNASIVGISPYIKAVTRDIKQYLKAKDYRKVPVGYSAADVESIRLDLAHYLNCGSESDERIDMLGVNDYSWCGDSSYILSGYKEKVSSYSGYSIPIFMSEFGCNKVVSTRPFTEIGAIYSDLMAPVFSGGLVYQYSQDVNDYGLVQISADGNNVTTLTDFDNLKKEFNATSNPTGDAGASSSYNISSCPIDWNFNLTVPDQPNGLQSLLKNGPSDNYGFEADTQSSCDEDDDTESSASSSSSVSSFVSKQASNSSIHSSSIHSSSVKSSSSTAASSTEESSSSSTLVSSIASSSHKNSASNMIAQTFASIVALVAGVLYL